MSEIESKEIPGGYKVRAQPFGCMRALPMWVRICNVIAPALAALEGLSPPQRAALLALTDELTIDGLLAVAPLFAPFLAHLDGDALQTVARLLLGNAIVIRPDGKKIECQGNDVQIEAAFGTNIRAMLHACLHIGILNFAGFTVPAADRAAAAGVRST